MTEKETSATTSNQSQASAGSRPMTMGEYRVGITFNPSNSPNVDRIKHAAADLIDLVQSIVPEGERSEAARCAAIACTEIESAAMWAVKAATKQPRA